MYNISPYLSILHSFHAAMIMAVSWHSL